jgi:hypothetical protein
MVDFSRLFLINLLNRQLLKLYLCSLRKRLYAPANIKNCFSLNIVKKCSFQNVCTLRGKLNLLCLWGRYVALQ